MTHTLRSSRRQPAALVALLLSFLMPLTAQAISRDALVAYAASLKGKKQAELKTAIYALSQPQTVLDYGSGEGKTWWGFYETDRVAATNECVNRYSSNRFYFTGNRGQVVSGMNIEHSFPKSWWGGGGTANCDLFNLYPSDSQANSAKSNYPMAIVTTVTQSSGDGYDLVGRGVVDGQSGVQCWEPGDQYKGDFARGYMYMATTYQNYTWQSAGTQSLTSSSWPTLKQWAYELYLDWVAADPVSELETDRNDAVYAIQGNRNLYIDFPYLAEYVWGDSTDVAFDPATALTTASDDDRYTGRVEPSEDQIAQPLISPYGGTFSGSVEVTLSCSTTGATIFYTTDGTEPTTASTRYSAPFTLAESVTLKAVASLSGQLSAVSQATFSIRGGSSTEHGDTVYCLLETFDQCVGTGGGAQGFATGGSGDFTPDVDGWESQKAFGGSACARFGTGKVSGSVTTPAFTIPAGTTTLSFVAAPWGSDGNGLTLEVAQGDATLSATEFTLAEEQWNTCTATLTATASTTVQLTLTAPKRFWLDSFAAFYLKPEADAIAAPKADTTLQSRSAPIYDLSGRYMGNDASRLKAGTYVRKGIKFVLK